MGTDIHLYTERREGPGAPWVSADTWTRDETWGFDRHSEIWGDRSYDTFAILANVRNGSGFAGVRTGAGFVPISEPRDLPRDVSPEVAGAFAEYDWHSASWLTVAEMTSYDWTQTTEKQGVVGLEQLARWKIVGQPSAWSGGVAGPGIAVYDAEIAVASVERSMACCREQKIETPSWYDLMWPGTPGDAAGRIVIEQRLIQDLGCERPHFLVRWEVAYHEVAAGFLSTAMPRLWRLGPPEHVRIVFGFDS